MAGTLRPFVLWGQTDESISLKVDLRDATVSKLTEYLNIFVSFAERHTVINALESKICNVIHFRDRIV